MELWCSRNVKSRWMWVSRVVTPTTYPLFLVAVVTEALSVAAQTRNRIGARLHAVPADEVTPVDEITVRALWEL